MKKLLELNMAEVMQAITHAPVPLPITVQAGLEYLMFIEAISQKLPEYGGVAGQVPMKVILEVAREYGGLVDVDLNNYQGEEYGMQVMKRNLQESLYTRLTFLASRLLTGEPQLIAPKAAKTVEVADVHKFKTFNDWASIGFSVTKGSKATWIEGVAMFHEDQVTKYVAQKRTRFDHVDHDDDPYGMYDPSDFH